MVELGVGADWSNRDATNVPPQHMSRTVATMGTTMRRPRMVMGSRHLNMLRISLIMGIFWDNCGLCSIDDCAWVCYAEHTFCCRPNMG